MAVVTANVDAKQTKEIYIYIRIHIFAVVTANHVDAGMHDITFRLV